jgi:MSHA biogenesis protein MshK
LPAGSLAVAVAATPTVPVAAPPTFRLQGITFSATAPSALVNGRTVFVGDEVDGAMVTRIDQRSVTLAVEGRTQVLRMR